MHGAGAARRISPTVATDGQEPLNYRILPAIVGTHPYIVRTRVFEAKK